MIMRTLAAWAVAIASFSCYALEVGDLHLPLTRNDADKTLTKDYSFAVLTDGTIRRTWNIEKRTVEVDFDPVQDTAICITITYKSPVSRKTAEADADAMTPDPEAKWKKTKPEAVGKVGIPAGSSIKEFADKSMMFLEAASTKNKYSAVTYYAKAPHKNRKELTTVSGDQRTAMGSASMAGDVKFLIKDEEARQSRPLETLASDSTPTTAKPAAGSADDGEVTVTPTVTVATTTKPITTTPAKTPATKPVATTPRKETVAIVGSDGTEMVEGTVTTRTVTTTEEGEEYGNLADVVKDKASPVHLCIAGAVVIVLIFLIATSAARSRAKKRQKAQFTQVLLSSPSHAAKPAALRKAPVVPKKR